MDKYITVMFPYPSGSGLHVGHWYNYSIMDSYCRYQKYIGNNVFQPFGYDSFGLPAENYAKKVGRDVKDVTEENINNFRKTMDKMNIGYEELLSTHENQLFKQQIYFLFTELYKRGLAYKKDAIVDYCSKCETTLAKEQVQQGYCKTCNGAVTEKVCNQWYFRITDYKDRLIKGLDTIDYPKSTINAQRKWLENQHDWCVSRQRNWGSKIPILNNIGGVINANETDTLDTFVDSSIYTVVYCLIKGIKPNPVDLYVGGGEHACMHLIYIRFITMFLYDIGYIDFEEPFKKVIHQGMILNNGVKMSKSLGNVINLEDKDSDEIRFYLMFIGHYFDGGTWNEDNFKGITKFIRKLKVWFDKTGENTLDIVIFKNEIFSYTESFKFNKVVSSFMILYNKNKDKSLTLECKNEIVSLLEIYMPSIKNKINNG